MQRQSTRVAALSAPLVMSPVSIFAEDQPKLRVLTQSEMQDLSGTTQAVRQGKGGGRSRRNDVSIASEYHLATAKDLPAPVDESPVDESGDARQQRRDSAFRK
jgi:hypothetical protein